MSRRLILLLSMMPLLNCECGRDSLGANPDGGEEDAGIPDAGPPPAEYPLKPGDKVRYPPPNNVVFCNETIGPVGCSEQSVTWTQEYTVGAAGAAWNQNEAAWVVPAEYFWSVADVTRTDEPSFATLSQLWLSGFGPWEAANGQSDTLDAEFSTKSVMLQGGPADTFPFFDLAHWASASAAFEAFVRAKDPDARVENQEAARKIEAGYLEPTDPSQLHFVSIIYHAKGFVCSYQEFIGPWDPARQKNNSGFRNNERKYQAIINGVQLVRATGEHAGDRQTCKCGTQAVGLDCE